MEALGIYMKQIGKHELLTQDQEIDLGCRISTGNTDALHKLITSNLKYVVHVARRYYGLGLDFEDVIGEGNTGLIKAANKFDPSRGLRFSTYATPWIRSYILRAFSCQKRTVRLPEHVCMELGKYKRARNELMKLISREPAHDEIVEFMDTSTSPVKDLKLDQLDKVNISFDTPADEDGRAINERLPDGRESVESEFLNNSLLKKLLEPLTAFERDVLMRVHGVGGPVETMAEIGRSQGKSRMWISTTYKRSMRKIRNTPTARMARKEIEWNRE